MVRLCRRMTTSGSRCGRAEVACRGAYSADIFERSSEKLRFRLGKMGKISQQKSQKNTIFGESKIMSANLNTRKIHIIEQLTKLQDEAIILQIENLMQNESSEVELLQALNACTFPDEELHDLLELTEKRQFGELPEDERTRLFDLIKKEEQLRLERVNILGRLAQLKDIPLLELAEQLDIQAA